MDGDGNAYVTGWTNSADFPTVNPYQSNNAGEYDVFVTKIFENADSDGDGLSDSVETNTGTYVDENDTGTDPNNSDTDGDGRNDGREVDQGSDPNDDTDFIGIPDDERAALIELYNSTDGDNWTDNTNWLGNIGTECSWFRVTCGGDDEYVTSIDLNTNNLNGTIPPELGNLENLQYLSLFINQLNGNIPPELGNLENLQYLSLMDNQLNGSIPPELGNLASLQYLYLYKNQLNGNIPPELGNLENLYTLSLYDNQLNGNIPPELGNLANLALLYLNGNQLNGNIPLELGNLANLTLLYLYNNQLNGSIPPELGSLGNLQYLRLQGNMLSGPIPTSLKDLNLLLEDSSDFRWNALYADSTDPDYADLMNLLTFAQVDDVWQSTQTVAPSGLAVDTITDHSVELTWSPIPYTGDTGHYEVWHGIPGDEVVMVKDINPIAGGESNPGNLTEIGGTLYLRADDGIHGVELWKSDGTEAGTEMVKDINPGVDDSTPQRMAEMGGILYFVADDGTHGGELWTSDGTAAGTVMVEDMNTGAEWGVLSSIAEMNGKLYFLGNDGVGGNGLWTSDGTPGGAEIVKGGIISGGFWTVVGSTLFFQADDGTHGSELWKTDGTTAGTVMVKDINPGVDGSIPQELTEVNGTLFFHADDGTNGAELWKSDGTTAGTVMVKDIDPGADHGFPVYLTEMDGILYFKATDDLSGYGFELWKSDGTDAGTVMVKDINPSGHGDPTRLTEMGGILYFYADDGINGDELWKSDGTDAGTVMVKDIYPGAGDSSMDHLTNVNGTLYFMANDGTNGDELWKSDGTEQGTVMVKDIYPGINSSNPSNLTDVNGTLFFRADDGTNGDELWKSGTLWLSPHITADKTIDNLTVNGLDPGTEYAFSICTVTYPHVDNQNTVQSGYSAEVMATTADTGTDSDGDGVPDSTDNCPYVPNSGQENSDGDSAGDACDGCAADPDKTDPGICGCGIPDVDSNYDGELDCTDDQDGDGVSDWDDNCPDAPNGPLLGPNNQVDWDGDGRGDVCDDSDGDGQMDDTDPYPFDPDNDTLDNDGVPADPYELCKDLTAAICQLIDNCPEVFNDLQENSDGDAYGDACDENDAAPEAPCTERSPHWPECSDNDPVPDDDICTSNQDTDDICDDEDNCPTVDNPYDVDTDGDNIPDAQLNTDNDDLGDACDPDDDNDQIPDDGDGEPGGFCIGGNTSNCDDNCPLIKNSNQADMDCDGIGDACDDDIDGDGLYNWEEYQKGTYPDDADYDNDGISDGDKVPTDCNGIYNPPVQTAEDETPFGDKKYIEFVAVYVDADCNGTSDNLTNRMDTWLPVPLGFENAVHKPGDEPTWVQSRCIQIKAKLYNPATSTSVSFENDVEFTLSPSRERGIATNHSEECPAGICPIDYSFINSQDDADPDSWSKTVTISEGQTEVYLGVFSFDFGGSFTITASTVIPEEGSEPEYVAEGEVTLPLDSDNDEVPDIIEEYYGFDKKDPHSFQEDKLDGDMDVDTLMYNAYPGDGLTNRQEWRGIIYDIDGTKHERLNLNKKNLFVRGDYYQNSACQAPGNPDVLDFTLVVDTPPVNQSDTGNAFENAGIDVHDVTEYGYFCQEPPNIDVLVVTNKALEYGVPFETLKGTKYGLIQHPSPNFPRWWLWDLKGASYVGDRWTYAIDSDSSKIATETYHSSLMNYIYNRPYFNETPTTKPLWFDSVENECFYNAADSEIKLDPLDCVEDYIEENGSIVDRDGGKSEDRCIKKNSQIDGDRFMDVVWKDRNYGQKPFHVGFDFSVFDADADGYVELPQVDTIDEVMALVQGELNPGEYTPLQVQTQTIIHEIGHALGVSISHVADDTCVMFVPVLDWSHARHYCPEAIGQFFIHNE